MLWMMKMMMGDDVVVQVVISCCWIRVTATLIAQSVSQSVVEHICLSQSVSRWSRSLLVHRHWLPLTQGLLCVGCSALAGYHSSLHVHCTMHTEQYQLIRSTAVFCLSVCRYLCLCRWVACRHSVNMFSVTHRVKCDGQIQMSVKSQMWQWHVCSLQVKFSKVANPSYPKWYLSWLSDTLNHIFCHIANYK